MQSQDFFKSTLSTIFYTLFFLLFFISCNSANKEETAVHQVRAYYEKDSVIAIKERVAAVKRVYQRRPDGENGAFTIPLSYVIEAAYTFPIDLVYNPEDPEPEEEEEPNAEDTIRGPQKEWYYSLSSPLLEDLRFEETVMVADTALSSAVLMDAYKKQMTTTDRPVIDYLIYEDTTTYIGVSGFGDLLVYYFTPLSADGKRTFYYASIDDAPRDEAEKTTLAFQLLENAKALLQPKDSTGFNPDNFYNSLNLAEKAFLDRITLSLKKETERFLDTGTIARYMIGKETLLLLAHEPDATQALACIEHLPFNKAATLKNYCSIDKNLPERKHFIDLSNYDAGILKQQDSATYHILDVYDRPAFDDEGALEFKNRFYITPVTAGRKRFYMALRPDGEGSAALANIFRYIKNKIPD